MPKGVNDIAVDIRVGLEPDQNLGSPIFPRAAAADPKAPIGFRQRSGVRLKVTPALCEVYV